MTVDALMIPITAESLISVVPIEIKDTAFVDRPMVYIAAPYSSDPVPNTHRAIDVAEQLHATGLVTACIPHLNIVYDLVHPHPAEEWYRYDLSFLKRCDALLRIPGDSPGADGEVLFAYANDILVFHSIESVLEWARDFE